MAEARIRGAIGMGLTWAPGWAIVGLLNARRGNCPALGVDQSATAENVPRQS